jgi:predicted RNase H-like HicB family nuclease
MSTLAEDPPDGVEFIYEDDGRVTARHTATGVASFGESESEALRQLADALDSHERRGETIADPDAYLEEIGIDVEIESEGSLPWIDK